MQVPRSRIPEGIPRREVQLYSISGWFTDTTLRLEPSAVAFGGYFRYDPQDNVLTDGQLIDIWGSSTIEGRMIERVLMFYKKYDQSQLPIGYVFNKEGDLWVGEYSHPMLKGNYPAKALTTLIEPDAFDIVCGKLHKAEAKS